MVGPLCNLSSYAHPSHSSLRPDSPPEFPPSPPCDHFWKGDYSLFPSNRPSSPLKKVSYRRQSPAVVRPQPQRVGLAKKEPVQFPANARRKKKKRPESSSTTLNAAKADAIRDQQNKRREEMIRDLAQKKRAAIDKEICTLKLKYQLEQTSFLNRHSKRSSTTIDDKREVVRGVNPLDPEGNVKEMGNIEKRIEQLTSVIHSTRRLRDDVREDFERIRIYVLAEDGLLSTFWRGVVEYESRSERAISFHERSLQRNRFSAFVSTNFDKSLRDVIKGLSDNVGVE